MSFSLHNLFQHNNKGKLIKETVSVSYNIEENDENGRLDIKTVIDTYEVAQIKPDLELHEQPIVTYQDYLGVVDHISNPHHDPSKAKEYVKEFTRLTLHKFREHLIATAQDWNDSFNPKIYTIAKQLEAIASLTGEQEVITKILNQFPLLKTIRRESKNSQEENFLDNKSPLKFVNFDKNLLTVQMLLRVLDPRFIDQRDTQVCGVNSYVHNLALFNPVHYVNLVSELALEGQVDLKDATTGDTRLHIHISDAIANKQASSSFNEIHDADHIILNGLRDSENKTVGYSQEGDTFSKQLFGVTTHKEVNQWMKDSGFLNVQNIRMDTKTSLKQLELLIKDGYMTGFAGTSKLAGFILDNSQVPQKQNFFKQFMDGHFFTITNIEYNEQKDTVKVRIITWGTEVESEIPFKAWKEHLGVIGEAIVGQSDYANNLLRGKGREMVEERGCNCCSAEAYCICVKNVIENKPEFKEITKLLQEAFDHKDGQTWMDSAKKIQDYIERLPLEKRAKLNGVPKNIAIVPTNTPFDIQQIIKTKDPSEKIAALVEFGAQDNIEVQRQLINLYMDAGELDKVEDLLLQYNKYSATDLEIIKNSQLRHNQPLLDKVLALHSIKANDLIACLSKQTGLPEGGVFTYGIQGRLMEVVNQRRINPVDNLEACSLDRTDIINLLKLLDEELLEKNPSEEPMSQDDLETCSKAILSNSLGEPKEIDFYDKAMNLITDFFLKVASMFEDNLITKSVEKTKAFKNELNEAKNSSPVLETPIDAFSFRS